MKDMVEFVEAIIRNVKISWSGKMIIIFLLALLFVGIWILCKYAKAKSTIKENFKEFWNDLRALKRCKKAMLGVGGILFCVVVIGTCCWFNKSNLYQEIAILNNQNEVIYPIGVDILNERKVGEFTFFTYNVTEMMENDVITYPALYKWKEGKLAERISEGACPHFEVAKNSVIYLNSTLPDSSHGQLYVTRPDGMNERVMEEELYDFSIDEEYIYFTYCFDTVGVGLEGHALHRMDINGDNIITVAYELSSPNLQGSHYNVSIEDGWAIYQNYKIQIGNPADGLEKVILLDGTNKDWIYYTSNRLIKAKPDGTEQVVLDDENDFWYQIDKIERGWIYYQKGDDKYKIDINGNNKKRIEQHLK